MHRFGLRAALLGGGIVLSTVSFAQSDVLFDSNGFEAPDYSPLTFLDQNPVASSSKIWGAIAPEGVTPAVNAPYAAVNPYSPGTLPNFQRVELVASNATPNSRVAYYPFETFDNPYTAVNSDDVAITFSMNHVIVGAGNGFFGIEAYNAAGLIIAAVGINGTTGNLVGAATIVSPFTAAFNTVYNYELLLDYDTQSYSIYTTDAGDPNTFVLRGGGAFANSSTTFSDADISSFSIPFATNPFASDLPAYTGGVLIDDYVVQTIVPEPASLGLAALALGLLVRRRAGQRA